MRTSFTSPSGNYNLFLSEDDLKRLLEGKTVLLRPSKVNHNAYFNGVKQENDSHILTYNNKDIENFIQFITISMEE